MESKTADTDGTIIEFMQGSHSYDGIWFGEPHPILKGQFWWRTILREYLSSGQFQHPVPDEAPKEWEEQAIKDYENGYESETSAIDKFVFADEAGEVYTRDKLKRALELQIEECAQHTQRCARDKGQASFEMKEWIESTPLIDYVFKDLPTLSPAPPSGEDAGEGKSNYWHLGNISRMKEMAEIQNSLKEAVELIQYFVDRVDAGTIRSKITYSKYKEFLSSLTAPKP